jgi:hypothetical protein
MLANYLKKENIIIAILILVLIQNYWFSNQISSAIEPAVRYSVSNSDEIQKLKKEIKNLERMIETLSEK